MTETFKGRHKGTTTAVVVSKLSVKKDPLEIQHPKLENSRLGLLSPFMRDNGRCNILHDA